MKSFVSVQTVLLAVYLAQAANAEALDPAKPISQQIGKVDSEFNSTVQFIGPDIIKTAVAGDKLYVQLQAARDKKTGRIVNKVVLQAFYGGPPWRFYDSISLMGGKNVKAYNTTRHTLSCSRGSCDLAEATFVMLDEGDFKTALSDGMKMRWNGRYADFDLEIPSDYFRAMDAAAK